MALPFPFHEHPSRRRGWVPAAVIAAGIIVAAAVVAGALILTSHRSDTATKATTAGKSTCAAWRATATALKTIPELPAGWTWQTPNIDLLIANHSTLVSQALDTFEPQISDTPANVAAAARTFVSARRHEILLLANRTYDRADGAPGDAAFAQLTEFCTATTPT